MKRTAMTRRTPMRSHPKAPKKKHAVPGIPKATGARIDGGKNAHQRSADHIALVKAQPCLVSRRLGAQYVAAHHPDEIFPDLVAQQRKISDFLCVPLAHELHDPGHPGSLHKSNRPSWWAERGVRPLHWLLIFLKRHYPPGACQGADEAITTIRRRIAMNEGA